MGSLISCMKRVAKEEIVSKMVKFLTDVIENWCANQLMTYAPQLATELVMAVLRLLIKVMLTYVLNEAPSLLYKLLKCYKNILCFLKKMMGKQAAQVIHI